MLWYGVLGIRNKDGKDRFIYDFEYSMKRLTAEAKVLGKMLGTSPMSVACGAV